MRARPGGADRPRDAHPERWLPAPGAPSWNPLSEPFAWTVLDSVRHAVISTDPDGDVIYWNRAAEELYGWTAAEARGRPLVELTPHQSWRQQAEAIIATLRSGRRWSGELLVRRRDGRPFVAAITALPLFRPGGELAAMIGFSTAVAAPAPPARQFGRAVERLRAAIETMRGALAVYSAIRDERGAIVDFRVEYVNQFACDAHRMPREAQVGRTLLELFPSGRDSVLFDECLRAAERGEPSLEEASLPGRAEGWWRHTPGRGICAFRCDEGIVVAWGELGAPAGAADY